MNRARLAAFALSVFIAAPALAQFASEADRREALQLYRRGAELMTAERFEQALDAFGEAVKKDRLLTQAHYGMGQAYGELRRYAHAIVAYRACRDAFAALHSLEESQKVSVEQWRDDEIRALRETMRLLQQSNAAPLKVLNLERRIEELERQRRAGRGAFVPPAEVSLALGSAYFRTNQFVEAEQEWRAATSANPRLGEAHNNLAALYAMQKRKQDAALSVRAAEKAGFRVHPGLKAEIQNLN